MEGAGVIDRFLDTFARYIDSGFGLIGGDVGFLASSLIVIDVTLAFLFWTWGEGEDIAARLVRKTLQVGFFAFLISNWNGLAKIIYLSFSGLGLKAAGSGSADDLLHPGKIAATGIDAARPLFDQATALAGPVGIFTNFAQIAMLLLAFAIVLLAFFIIAIQLFVTLIEFKLTTLAGFVLVPFGLFGRTAFLAERVLGNVMATGVKVLVLAVIIGIGSTIFHEFVIDFGGTPPTLEQVGAIALAALTLLGLAIFGPGIASGLISGGPQLGAGAAIGTGMALAGVGTAAGMAAAGTVGLAGRATSAAASTLSRSPGAPPPGGSSSAPPPPAPTGGAPTVPPPSGAPGGGGSARPGDAGSASTASASGEAGATAADGNTAPEALVAETAAGAPAAEAPTPAWAKRLRRRQAMVQGATLAAHTLRSADHHGGAAHVSLEDRS
ncbi:conjugal transfer protein TrbL [Sphingobium sp. 22B]|uniref:P-type conjugative transfer protein TrbL n=1 Tax=unclassified Sphingobium TaxID=2611147 RepID=UPI000786461A|nr:MULTISPECIES: P-type conjugative transfer protein TrbL [unclassified Sphingobium]KXU32394.1 conjugal transfer protein TrbL [Sphingobium sp. AM]KYC32287.1 conjugal transfer protein TrbL [Sphingobium sp. 22B]OAP31917.1 P-type conjugative transfer protein TrbL [Sphingobium sp. 20006FA]